MHAIQEFLSNMHMEMNGTPLSNRLKTLDENERIAVVLGDFYHSVRDGGLSSWVHSGLSSEMIPGKPPEEAIYVLSRWLEENKEANPKIADSMFDLVVSADDRLGLESKDVKRNEKYLLSFGPESVYEFIRDASGISYRHGYADGHKMN